MAVGSREGAVRREAQEGWDIYVCDELYIYGYTSNKNAGENSWFAQLWRVFAGSTPDSEYIRITNEDIK